MAVQQLNNNNNTTSWSENYTFSNAGTRSYTFLTGNTYTDRDISLSITVPSAEPAFTGGAITGNATASGTSCTISNSTNNSGVSITASADATRAKVIYSGVVNGWVNKSAGADAYSENTTNLTSTTYYINGVNITKPDSGTHVFTITVPNGNGNITFTFNVDANGNTTIT